jgi:asparagine synthase (glutamine-hydrolysing)
MSERRSHAKYHGATLEMCGIAGIILKPNQPLSDLRERLNRMQSAMHHRGPDDSGMFVDSTERIGLVNRRLAIRDLSPAGHMPMTTGKTWITYNGEVFNADELRQELIHQGCHFQSTSDTEVILQGYEAWGLSVVDRLRGQFAFVIADFREDATGKVFLVRDRLGIKPLYYAATSEAFVFASELKALQASGLISTEISPVSIVAYLTMGSVPYPMTIYRDIQGLEPATILELDTITPKKRTYWQLPSANDQVENPEGLVERVRSRLSEAVNIRLISDVPLGAFLSGGLDSSSVVALMRQASNGSIRTCSMVFEEAEYSESTYSRAVAEQLGTEHFERVITQHDVIDRLDHIFSSIDQPSIDGVNTYFVSLTAREAGLTVALSGLGGDELFGGYSNTFSGIPELVRNLQMVHSVPGAPQLIQFATQIMQEKRWLKLSDAAQRPPSLASAYIVRRGLFSLTEVKQMVTPEVWNAAVAEFDPVDFITRWQPDSDSKDIFNWVSQAELQNYTHNQLLRDTDAMSMAHSLEVRVPLLDHVLVEDILQLPASVKKNGTVQKYLLTEAVGSLLPEIVRNRNEKYGFVFPFATWLSQKLGNKLQSELGNSSEYLNTSAVTTNWQAFEKGQLHWSRLWGLVALQGWQHNIMRKVS